MNEISSLQAQFPLSISKKFQKKLLSSLVFILAIDLLIFSLILAIYSLASIVWSVPLILVSTLIAIIAISFAIYIWYIKTYIRTYYYSADENFLTIKKGVFTPAEIHVQYQKIQDVYVDQDILDRILGIYDVHIASATASSSIEAHIDGVDKVTAEGLKNFLLKSIQTGSATHIENSKKDTNNSSLKFISEEEISSDKYPLSNSWFNAEVVSRVFGSLVAGLFLTLMVFSRFDASMDLTILLSVVWIVASAIWSIISLIIWKKNYAFKFNEDFIYFKTGVLSMNEKHMPYSSVQDITVFQSLLGRIFGFSELIIKDATQTVITKNVKFNNMQQMESGIRLVGLNPADAQKISEIAKKTILNRNTGGVNGL